MPGSLLVSGCGLTLGYKEVPVVCDVSFDLAQGDVLAVAGHNGSGKSTLIKTLLGSLPLLAGNLTWHLGQDSSPAYLGQLTEFDRRFPLRVRDLAAMGTWPKLGLFGRIDRRCKNLINHALERTGIAQIANQPLHQLSAGQLQRALFARTMVQDSPFILLDEPFMAVDQTTEAALLELVDEWAREGRTVILVLHDLSAVMDHCHKALLLGNGRSLFGRPEDVLNPENLIAHGYLSKGQAAWFEGLYAKKVARHV